jgi:hypothetical protein
MSMANASISSDEIKKKADAFRILCAELSISTTNKNSICQRLLAAEAFCAAQKPFSDVDREILIKSGEFFSLAECLEQLKDRIKGTLHVKKLLSERTYANELAELETAVLCERAGYPAVLDEPDVVASVGTEAVSFACKRIESDGALMKRADEACDQIARYNRPGIAVIDVSRIVQCNPDVVFQTEDQATQFLMDSTEKLWKRFEPQLLKKMQEPLLNSYLWIASQFCCIQRHVDHANKKIQVVSFRPVFLSFRSRTRGRAACVVKLEDAILQLKLTP